MPNFMFCGGRDRHDKDFLFLFLNFDTVLKNSTPEKLPTFDGSNEIE